MKFEVKNCSLTLFFSNFPPTNGVLINFEELLVSEYHT